jgi:phosphatidylglycerol:prolipoprotein diacylglycerol transferase
LVFYGGLALALPVGLWYLEHYRLPRWKTADVWAAPLPLGHAVGRLGCFAAGCCYGRPTDVPWAVTFTDPNSLALLGLPLHPTQLYEAFGNLLIFCFLSLYRRHRRFPGQLFWLYVLLYSCLRFFLEFFRGDPRGYIVPSLLSVSQGIALVLVVLSLGLLARLGRAQRV